MARVGSFDESPTFVPTWPGLRGLKPQRPDRPAKPDPSTTGE